MSIEWEVWIVDDGGKQFLREETWEESFWKYRESSVLNNCKFEVIIIFFTAQKHDDKN